MAHFSWSPIHEYFQGSHCSSMQPSSIQARRWHFQQCTILDTKTGKMHSQRDSLLPVLTTGSQCHFCCLALILTSITRETKTKPSRSLGDSKSRNGDDYDNWWTTSIHWDDQACHRRVCRIIMIYIYCEVLPKTQTSLIRYHSRSSLPLMKELSHC